VVCDDLARCPLTLIDVATGDRRVVSGVTTGREATRAAFSPDGERLAVFDGVRGVAAPTIVDVATGATQALVNDANTYGIKSLAWSPSGDWLFWVAGGTVRATRRDGGATYEVLREVQPIFAVYALMSQ
jgi:dipeptidyl aminopeptidase/acylaminoacyl peptidase